MINEDEEEEDSDEDEREERDYVREADEDQDEYLEQEEEDETNVQMSESDDDDDEEAQKLAAQKEAHREPEVSYYFAGDTNLTPDGKEYVRQFPEGFDEDSQNQFMHHILAEYALEQKDSNGKPSGQFLMNKKWTQVAAREVLQKHKKLEGEALDKYMNQFFGRTWEHFDVNEAEVLDASDMPAFMKYLCSD